MDIHVNARLTPVRRKKMALSVISGRLSCRLSRAQAARHLGVSCKIVSRWAERFRAEEREGMQDRSSRPRVIPTRTAAAALAERFITYRRQRRCGCHIAELPGVSPTSVRRVPRRAGLSRLKELIPAERVVRHACKEQGGLIRLDIKKLGRFERVGHRITEDRTGRDRTGRDRTGQGNGRGVGWVEPLSAIGPRTMAKVHIAIDDALRVAVTGIHPDEKATSAIAALRAVVACDHKLAFNVTRGMPPSRRLQAIACRALDNGSCCKSFAFAAACEDRKLKPVRAKPYTCKTDGKAARVIQTALREWAYARACETSDQRKSHLPEWTHMSNWHRPHGGPNS